MYIGELKYVYDKLHFIEIIFYCIRTAENCDYTFESKQL